MNHESLLSNAFTQYRYKVVLNDYSSSQARVWLFELRKPKLQRKTKLKLQGSRV